MQVYLVRHAAPANAAGLCYGRLEVPVTAQASAAAAALVSSHIPRRTLDAASIYCSPASRCLDLARHLAAPRAPTPSPHLVEMHFGAWQGCAWDALPREQLDAWANDVWGYPPGGGESAEQVAARWQRWLTQVRRLETPSVIAVTHAGVIRVALARSSPLGTTALQATIAFGSVHCLDIA